MTEQDTSSSLRPVAIQLRTLSADEENQPIIARDDGCMRAIVGFITMDLTTTSQIEISQIAIEALTNLSSHPDNYETLRNEEGLLEGLKQLIIQPNLEQSFKREIFSLLEELTDEDNDDELDQLDELERKSGLKMNPNTQYSVSSSSSNVNVDDGLLSYPITARIHIQGISDDVVCSRVEQLIIQKRGVVSVAFELASEIAVVYTRLPIEQLAAFLTTMTGTHVEILPDITQDEEDDDEEDEVEVEKVKGQSEQSGYLDKSGQRLKDVAKKSKKKHTISQGASSLHERLKAQREEEGRKKARANRLMDSIGRGVRTGWGLF